MIELLLIGIGTGNPDHLTLQAVRAMNSADIILIPRKGAAKADLADLRESLCAGVLTGETAVVGFDLPVRRADGDYLDGVADWHEAIALTWAALLRRHLPDGGRAALLVWGDPSLYDSSLRIAARVIGGGLPLDVRVVPGLTSLQLLTAAHAIPLNTLGAAFVVTTGRQLRATGWPAGIDTMAVMLDGDCAFQTVPPQGVTIFWGAYLGMPQEVLVSGSVAEVGPQIIAKRAALREAHGWIMDIYLLRRS